MLKGQCRGQQRDARGPPQSESSHADVAAMALALATAPQKASETSAAVATAAVARPPNESNAHQRPSAVCCSCASRRHLR